MQQSRQTRPAARIDKRCAPKKLSKATGRCLRCTAPSPWRARAAGAGFVTPPSRTKLTRLILLSMAVTGEQMTELCSTIRKDEKIVLCSFLAVKCTMILPRWWQSPSLQYGPAYQSVTLTINLGQLYQVPYNIMSMHVVYLT